MMKHDIQQERGTCPVCSGSLRRTATESWAKIMRDYDAATHTLPCRNCGAQYQFGWPSGRVPLNRAGQPCQHNYTESNIGRCLTLHVCEHCGDSHTVDSSD